MVKLEEADEDARSRAGLRPGLTGAFLLVRLGLYLQKDGTGTALCYLEGMTVDG